MGGCGASEGAYLAGRRWRGSHSLQSGHTPTQPCHSLPRPRRFLFPPPITRLGAGQTALAYVTAATHGLTEEAERLGEQLGELRPSVDVSRGEHRGVGALSMLWCGCAAAARPPPRHHPVPRLLAFASLAL